MAVTPTFRRQSVQGVHQGFKAVLCYRKKGGKIEGRKEESEARRREGRRGWEHPWEVDIMGFAVEVARSNPPKERQIERPEGQNEERKRTNTVERSGAPMNDAVVRILGKSHYPSMHHSIQI